MNRGYRYQMGGLTSCFSDESKNKTSGPDQNHTFDG